MSSGLNKLVKQRKRVVTSQPITKRPPLIITDPMEAFFMTNDELVVETQDEEDLWVELMRPSPNQVRHGRFGASSRGQCARRQVFKFLGMPGAKIADPRLMNIFWDGKLRHMKWQLIWYKLGLVSTTWPFEQALPDGIEAKFVVEPYRLSVSLDGYLDGEYFIEAKGMYNYSGTMTDIDHKHKLQMHTCMIASRTDKAIYLAEEKGSNNWREIVVYRDEAIIAEVKKELNELNEAVDDEELPPVKTLCRKKMGEYKECEFAAHCMEHERMGDPWPEQGQWAHLPVPRRK